MPFLTHWNEPFFETIGEVVDFFRQTIEGLHFLHSRNIAHNDVKSDNIMMDSRNLYDVPVHPASPEMRRDWSGPAAAHTRTERSVSYLYIDFALTERYTEASPRRSTWYGGDRTVPEFVQGDADCDPFAVDVYRLGNVFRESITMGSDYSKKYRGFDFMQSLISDMTQDNPEKRPKMDDVLQRFDNLSSKLGWWKLRSRVVAHDEPLSSRIRNCFVHWTKQLKFMRMHLPAVPRRSNIEIPN